MIIQEFLKENHTTDTNKIRPHIFCKDGLELSVQASSGHYCAPREDNAEEYTHVEVMCPILTVRSLCKYSTGGVCAMVPVEAVDNVIKRHGGIVRIGGRNKRVCYDDRMEVNNGK